MLLIGRPVKESSRYDGGGRCTANSEVIILKRYLDS